MGSTPSLANFVGNVENPKAGADTTTLLSPDGPTPTTRGGASSGSNVTGWNNSDLTITLGATDNPGGSGVKQITFSAAGAPGDVSTNVAGSLATAYQHGRPGFFALEQPGRRPG
jgi:hypothetical protein